MSNSIIGHTEVPQEFLCWYEVEVEEDEYEDIEGEIVFDTGITGFRSICPKNSQTTTITFKYYYYAPTSEWYWNYSYSTPYSPVIPLVYTCDSNWKLLECLNQNYIETSFANQANGWKTVTATLKRKLQQGERLFFGLYADTIGFAALGESDADTTSCYQYYSLESRRGYASQIAYFTSDNWYRRHRNFTCDYEVCLYIEYENEIESVAYSRTVLGNVGATTANSRKLIWKRTVPTSGNLTALFTRKSGWKRNTASDGSVLDNLKNIADYKRMPESVVVDEESVIRWGESFRSLTDEVEFEARPFASRLFFRTVQTVMSFWDWLRGKIREANNVASFYCPIWTEIEMECRI